VKLLINSYIEEISKRINGKRVLDIGCCASTSKNLLKRHFIYKQHTKEIVGVDYNKTLIKEAKERFNYDVHYCDLTERKDVERIHSMFGEFEHIICTDVIEHIGNLTNFLDNVKFMLTDKGTLHLTTPNMRSPRWLNMFNKGGKIRVNKDHICWFDVFTLSNLLRRSNLIIDEEIYYSHDTQALSNLKLQVKDWMATKLYVTIKRG
jgi:2-polyprenyl-3-methyl-5-hydroxy-6-metoxy-1,4-benzoquinol methylase